MTNTRRNLEIDTLKFKKQYKGKVADLAKEVFNYLDHLDTRFGLDIDYLNEYEESVVFEYAFQAQKSWNSREYLDNYFKGEVVRAKGPFGVLLWDVVFSPCCERMTKDLKKIFKKYDESTVYQYLD